MPLHPCLGPARTGEAIIGKKGDERRFGGRNAEIAGCAYKQPSTDLDHWHLDPGAGQQRQDLASARVDHHDLERLILIQQGCHRLDDLSRRAIADDNDGKLRRG
ncbi:hypothetical protein NKJ16_00220 [Mesorhizobium sp. M0179]